MRKGIQAEKNEKDDAGYFLKVSKQLLGKFLKKTGKKFGGKEKVAIFAARFGKNGSSLTILKD